MAKPLREPPPSSSVARLFDSGAAARALATTSIATAPSVASKDALTVVHQTLPRVDVPNLKREVVLTESTARTLDHLVTIFRQATGSRLTTSHVARAILKAIAHAMDTIEREARMAGPMKLPSNARDRNADRELFEHRIAAALVAGLRSSSSMPAQPE